MNRNELHVKVYTDVSMSRIQAERCLRLLEMFLTDNNGVEIAASTDSAGQVHLRFVDLAGYAACAGEIVTGDK